MLLLRFPFSLFLVFGLMKSVVFFNLSFWLASIVWLCKHAQLINSRVYAICYYTLHILYRKIIQCKRHGRRQQDATRWYLISEKLTHSSFLISYFSSLLFSRCLQLQLWICICIWFYFVVCHLNFWFRKFYCQFEFVPTFIYLYKSTLDTFACDSNTKWYFQKGERKIKLNKFNSSRNDDIFFSYRSN